jgi:hypothetical protein
VNYVKHIVYSPDTYHRRFDYDCKAAEDPLERVALAALPVISLIRPVGFAASLVTGAMRVFSQENLFQTAMAVIALAGTIFNFTIGLIITTVHDICLSIQNFEWAQTLISGAYLTFMLTGVLEALLLFALLQGALSLYQARKEFLDGRIWEGISKTIVGLFRLFQADGYRELIVKRNRMSQMEKYAALIRRAMKAREVRHLLDSPLLDGKPVVFTDEKGKEYNFGAHFHGFGEELVKGANITAKPGELEFKVNHVFRDKIQGVIAELSSLKEGEINDILKFTQSHATGIKIEKASLPGGPGQATKVSVEGLGSIFIGATKDFPGMYDRVVVQMDSGKNIYDFHEMMAFLDLDPALHKSTEEHLERLKMGHLFRTFFPREATPFERTEEYFNTPPDQLRAKMIAKAPEMEQIFQEHTLTPEEILPGKVRYRINGLADKVRERGGVALTAAILGAKNEKELFHRVSSILDMGMLSIETKALGGLKAPGISTDADYHSGGSDSVYMQMITDKNCESGFEFQNLNYHSPARLIISLDALETGTYQYTDDSFGTRQLNGWWSDYRDRPSIFEFTQELQNYNSNPNYPWWYTYSGHEIMGKERVPPSQFTGLILPDQGTKDRLITYLDQHGRIQNGTLAGKPVDTFLRVGTTASHALLA